MLAKIYRPSRPRANLDHPSFLLRNLVLKDEIKLKVIISLTYSLKKLSESYPRTLGAKQHMYRPHTVMLNRPLSSAT
jgi:hypothetical protein